MLLLLFETDLEEREAFFFSPLMAQRALFRGASSMTTSSSAVDRLMASPRTEDDSSFFMERELSLSPIAPLTESAGEGEREREPVTIST